jgi:hypothetical protein
MISRLSALAAVFAIVTTASLAYAANVKQQRDNTAASAPAEVVVLQTVQITAKRSTFSN